MGASISIEEVVVVPTALLLAPALVGCAAVIGVLAGSAGRRPQRVLYDAFCLGSLSCAAAWAAAAIGPTSPGRAVAAAALALTVVMFPRLALCELESRLSTGGGRGFAVFAVRALSPWLPVVALSAAAAALVAAEPLGLVVLAVFAAALFRVFADTTVTMTRAAEEALLTNQRLTALLRQQLEDRNACVATMHDGPLQEVLAVALEADMVASDASLAPQDLADVTGRLRSAVARLGAITAATSAPATSPEQPEAPEAPVAACFPLIELLAIGAFAVVGPTHATAQVMFLAAVGWRLRTSTWGAWTSGSLRWLAVLPAAVLLSPVAAAAATALGAAPSLWRSRTADGDRPVVIELALVTAAAGAVAALVSAVTLPLGLIAGVAALVVLAEREQGPGVSGARTTVVAAAITALAILAVTAERAITGSGFLVVAVPASTLWLYVSSMRHGGADAARAEVRTDLMAMLVRAGQRERGALTEAIYGGPLPELMSALVRLELARDTGADPGAALSSMSGQLGAAAVGLRDALNVGDIVVVTAGLPAAVASLCAQTPSSPRVSFEVRLPRSFGIAPEQHFSAAVAYIVIKEALANVIAHSRAHRARVTITLNDRELVVVVTDDGAVSASSTPRALVHDVIREYAVQVDGTATIDSHPGRGTAVTVRIPNVDRRRSARGPQSRQPVAAPVISMPRSR